MLLGMSFESAVRFCWMINKYCLTGRKLERRCGQG